MTEYFTNLMILFAETLSGGRVSGNTSNDEARVVVFASDWATVVAHARPRGMPVKLLLGQTLVLRCPVEQAGLGGVEGDEEGGGDAIDDLLSPSTCVDVDVVPVAADDGDASSAAATPSSIGSGGGGAALALAGPPQRKEAPNGGAFWEVVFVTKKAGRADVLATLRPAWLAPIGPARALAAGDFVARLPVAVIDPTHSNEHKKRLSVCSPSLCEALAVCNAAETSVRAAYGMDVSFTLFRDLSRDSLSLSLSESLRVSQSLSESLRVSPSPLPLSLSCTPYFPLLLFHWIV